MLSQFIRQIAVALAYLPARNAGHNGIGFHVLGNNTPGTAHRSLTDMNSRKYNNIQSDPCPVVNLYRKLLIRLVLIAPELRIAMVMLERVNRHITRQIHVIAKRQPVSRVEEHIIADDASTSDNQTVRLAYFVRK